MRTELFKKETNIKVPIEDKVEGCAQIAKIQHTSKPRLKSRYVTSDVEVLKFRCLNRSCPHRIREVIAGIKFEELNQELIHITKIAKDIRVIVGCMAESSCK